MSAATVGIRELKNSLSAYLERVRAGETMTVSDRGRPIALIVPLGGPVEHTIRDLVRAGRLSWAGGKPQGSSRPPVVRGRPVSDAVIEDRR
ncbi:MAG: type II toxin-antitoxin system prevent-host-death family antitoxin [Deltaproteobacteria bacterium]|nr:type II toxin-antitoxin system prevent-host-death family antitoxin [Deltaproteobacteria bacterium]